MNRPKFWSIRNEGFVYAEEIVGFRFSAKPIPGSEGPGLAVMAILRDSHEFMLECLPSGIQITPTMSKEYLEEFDERLSKALAEAEDCADSRQ